MSVHVWTEGKITEQQKAHAAAANVLVERIHARLASATGTLLGLSPYAVERLLGDLPRQLALTEAQLWAASQTAVKDINIACAALQDLLVDKVRGIPLDTAVGMANDYSRFVTTAMETLTSIQSRTMLTDPGVALAAQIAKDCQQAEREGSTIEHADYWAWRAAALDQVNVERNESMVRCICGMRGKSAKIRKFTQLPPTNIELRSRNGSMPTSRLHPRRSATWP